MEPHWVTTSRMGAVCTVALHAPAGPFRLNETSTAQLWAAVRTAIEDSGVRVVVLTGAETAWNVGGDLARMHEAGPGVHAVVAAIGESINPLIEALHVADVVSIAAVRGTAAGGGFGLMCACDLVIAAEDAVFTLGYSRLGANPDAGVTWFLPRMLGYRRALDLYLSSARLTAREALGLGLVSHVVPDADVDGLADQLANRVAELSPDSVRTTKRLFREAFDVPLRERTEEEIARFARASRTEHFAEGLSAFFARRDPVFS